MNKQRLSLLISLSIGLIAPIYAGNISVTTTADDGNQNGQCSLREAVTEANNAFKIKDARKDISDLTSDLEVYESRIREYNLSELYGEPGVLCTDNAQAVKDDNDRISISIEQALFGTSNEEDIGLCGSLNNTETEIDELNTLIDDIESAPQDCEGAEGVLDSILLTAGETYTLDEALGEIVIDAPTTLATQNYLNEDGNLATIDAQGASRIFFQEKADEALTISGIILTGGSATAADDIEETSTDGFGGAIFTNGTLNLEDTVIQESSAQFSGGGVYLGASARGNFNNADFINNSAAENGGGVSAAGILLISSAVNDDKEANLYQGNAAGLLGGAIFFSGTQITIDESRIGTLGKGNTATIAGGGVAIAALGEDSVFVDVQRTSILDNEVNGTADNANSGLGGGFYLVGLSQLTIENSTIAQNSATNSGGGLFIQNFGSSQQFNNLTVVENSANEAAGIAQLSLGTTPSAPYKMFNSVIAFNGEMDCLFNYNENIFTETVTQTDSGTTTQTVALTAVNIEFANNVYGSLADCEVPLFITQEDNKETGDLTLTDFFEPPFNDIDNGYIPKPVESTAVETRIFNAGGSETSPYSCKSIDQRTESRYNSIDGRCDIGAIEYQSPGSFQDQYTGLIQGQQYCLGILGNDVKDGAFSFTTEEEVMAALSVRSQPDAGGKAEVISECPEGAIAQDDYIDQDLDGDGNIDSTQEGVTVKPAGILYTAPDIFGQERLVYQVVMPNGDIQSAEALLNITPPQSDFGNYSRGSVTGFGSFGGWMIALLAVFSMARFKKHIVISLVFLSSHAWSAEITVDTCIDPYDSATSEIPSSALSDGFCSLREAILSSRNNQVNLSSDCEDGEDTSRDRIILKSLTEDDAAFADCDGQAYEINDTLDVFSRTIFECEGYEDKALNELCTIKAATSDFRLIHARDDIEMMGLSFEGGNAESSGGAILAEASVEMIKATFKDNSALQGGAVMFSGISSNLFAKDVIFENNSASTTDSSSGGGAIATNALNEHSIQIINASFINNSSQGSGGAVFFAGTDEELTITNATFYQNSAQILGGAMHIANYPGDITLQNISFVDNSAATANSIYGFNEASRTGNSIYTNTVFSSEGVNCANAETAEDNSSLVSAFIRSNEESCVVLPEEPEVVADPGELPAEPTEEQQNNYDAYQNYLINQAIYDFSVEISNISDLNDSFVFDDTLAMPVVIPTHERVINQNINSASSFPCEDEDQLGIDRNTGNACDIGAVEKQELTAIDDFPGRNFSNENKSVASNTYSNPDSCRFLAIDKDPSLDVAATANYTTGRSVIIDVLANDVADLAAGLDSESVTVTDGANATLYSIEDDILYDFLVAPSEQEIYSDKDLEECLTDRKANFSDFVLLFDNPERLVGIQTLTYSVSTEDGNATDSAYVQLDIQNIAPLARNDEFRINANNGLVITLDISANDTDDDSLTDELINTQQCASFAFTKDDISTSNTELNDYMNRFFDEDNLNSDVLLQDNVIYFYNDNGDDLLSFTATTNEDLQAQSDLVRERLIEKLRIETPPVFGSLVLDPKTCGVSYEVSSVFQVANDSFSYQLADYENDDSLDQIQLSNIAQVEIIMTGPGTQDAVDSLPHTLTKGGSFDFFGVLGLAALFGLSRLRRKQS